jgi:periplasmic protein TonB
MTTRFLTHFSTLMMVHAVVIFGGWQFSQSEMIKSQIASPGLLKVQVASQLLMAQPLETPRPKKVKPLPRPQVSDAPAPKVAPAEPVSALSAMARADLKSLYHAELRERIESNKFYPPMSKRLGQTGLVVVAFTLLKDGHIIDVRIDTPSRFDRLNASALEAVKKVERFKPIPDEIGENRMEIKVPVKFFTM